MMADPNFWNDQNKAQEIIDKNNALKSIVNGYHNLANEVDDMSATRELLQEEYDEDMKEELENTVIQFKDKMDQFELQLLLDGHMMQIMPYLNFIQAPEELNHKIGRVCY